jgi:hypothetical protein
VREPLLVENVKKALFLRGLKTSPVVTSLLKDLVCSFYEFISIENLCFFDRLFVFRLLTLYNLVFVEKTRRSDVSEAK